MAVEEEEAEYERDPEDAPLLSTRRREASVGVEGCVGVGVEGRIRVYVRDGLDLVGESSDGKEFGDQDMDQVEQEKKENGPYDVPTNGALRA